MTLYYYYYFRIIDSIVRPIGTEFLIVLLILYFIRLAYYIFFIDKTDLNLSNFASSTILKR